MRQLHTLFWNSLLLAIIVIQSGCSRRIEAIGYCHIQFATPDDFQVASNAPPVVIQHQGATLELTPRSTTPLDEEVRTVLYTVKLEGDSSWGVHNDHDFRELVRTHIRPKPHDVFGIQLDDLKYSERSSPRCQSIEEFQQRIWERGPGGYSLQEIAALIPNPAGLPDADACRTRQIVWLDWPADERDLSLEFEFDEGKQAVLMVGGGLGYRPQ